MSLIKILQFKLITPPGAGENDKVAFNDINEA